jgi:hypothetical protein
MRTPEHLDLSDHAGSAWWVNQARDSFFVRAA